MDNSQQLLESLGYKINNRTYEDVRGLVNQQIGMPGIDYYLQEVLYSGAEHTGNPKLPNLTYLPNFKTSTSDLVLGTTFGHQHNQHLHNDTRPFQEIYEFQNYGAMLLRDSNQTVLHLARPKNKVVVATNENMTLYSLDANGLRTLDYANPRMNLADKNLEKELKNFLTIAYSPRLRMARFALNRYYYQEHVKGSPESPIRVMDVDLGESLFRGIILERERFLQAGIIISAGDRVPEELKQELAPNLLTLVLTQNPCLMQSLKMNESNPPPASTIESLVYDESGTPIGK